MSDTQQRSSNATNNPLVQRLYPGISEKDLREELRRQAQLAADDPHFSDDMKFLWALTREQ
jgi:hypothetical protein